jgi:hypothetical protein
MDHHLSPTTTITTSPFTKPCTNAADDNHGPSGYHHAAVADGGHASYRHVADNDGGHNGYRHGLPPVTYHHHHHVAFHEVHHNGYHDGVRKLPLYYRNRYWLPPYIITSHLAPAMTMSLSMKSGTRSTTMAPVNTTMILSTNDSGTTMDYAL